MIVVKNSQLTNETVETLNSFIEMDINAKIAFRLMRVIKEISSLVEDKIKLEKRIFEKYLKRDENGNPLPVLDEQGNMVSGAVQISDMEAFNKDMFDIMSIENEIQYDKIDFDDMELEKVKVKDLMKIEFLFN